MELLTRLLGWRERRTAYETFPGSDPDSDSNSRNDRGFSASLEASRTQSKLLADFTLGFADGLTVPFALTAGLSSLGHTNTVIYAGTAELVAGCISMGIGGYLAAKGEQVNNDDPDENDDEEHSISPLVQNEQDRAISNYIAPLQLPPDLLQSVMAHIGSSPDIAAIVHVLSRDDTTLDSVRTHPIISGLCVALGYLTGGFLPLAPYFFVNTVTAGLRWSFGICLVALFIFGFTKAYVLNSSSIRKSSSRRNAWWTIVRRSIWEGLTMTILGSIAALAAVLAVRLFSGGAE
ncbi:Ccc1 family [Nemania sp. FL0031]|nr:Ccc1 family [Nemania sp. FL0031]